MDQAARIGLADITLDVAMISVWGIYSERVGDAVALAAQHNVKLTEDEMIELGAFWVSAWNLADRDVKKPVYCPLCKAEQNLSHLKDLCDCFQQKRIGKYINYDVPGRIKEIADEDPAHWRERTAEAFRCQTCKVVKDIELGKIADKFNQGKGWKTPSYCTECATAYKEQRRNEMIPFRLLVAPDTPLDAKADEDTEQ